MIASPARGATRPYGPISSQRKPIPGDIQNIDPAVLVDDDGRVYMYWSMRERLRRDEKPSRPAPLFR